MASNSFEIKIALVGHVSAGKTTVLNTLFAAPLGEVAMKRTTAGLNYFRMSPDDMHIAPGDILKRIRASNCRLRQDPKIEEEYFDVSMREPLLTTMRRNTQLVVVDIPGLNEAGTSNMYKTHVAKIWEAFDCVICVMDVYQGVNTEEQVQLLKFVKENADKSRSPVIILCNKVDEPENSEVQGLIREMEKEVEQIFGRAKVDFIPISAQNAYLYRAALGLPIREYASLGTEHIQRICKEEHGRSGLDRSSKAQRQLVFSIVNEPEKYQARLQLSNFSKLAAALNRLFGTRPLQAQALTLQMKLMYVRFQCGRTYDGVPVDQLPDRILRIWWDLWGEMKDDAIQKFRSDPDAREELRHLFQLPQQAGEYPKKLGDSPKKIYDAVKLLVQEKCGVIVGHILETPPDGNSKWRFCLRDWSDIIESITLMAHNQVFVNNFGRQIADLRFAMSTLSSRGDPSEVRCVLIPETPKDPDHWGHLEWLACQYLEENDEETLILINNSRYEKHCENQCTKYLALAQCRWEKHCENQCKEYLALAQGGWENHCDNQCKKYLALSQGGWENHCDNQCKKYLALAPGRWRNQFEGLYVWYKDVQRLVEKDRLDCETRQNLFSTCQCIFLFVFPIFVAYVYFVWSDSLGIYPFLPVKWVLDFPGLLIVYLLYNFLLFSHVHAKMQTANL